MASEHRGLDIGEDMQHQEREWKIEKVGWCVMAILVVANLLGLFGRGVLSERTAGETGAALQVHYHQYERYKAVTTLTLRIDPAIAGTTPRVTLGHEFASRVRISEIVPEPSSTEAGSDSHVYEFNVLPGAPAEIQIFYEPFDSGFVTARVGLENMLEYEFSQFYFP